MDNWLPFAILAPAIYAVNNFIDKLVIEKYIKEYYAVPIFTSILAFIFGTVFFIFSGFPQLSLKDTLLVMSSGAFLICGGALYFKALSKEETSLIIIMIQITPILVLILSFVFLEEQITTQQLIGFFLILIASVGVSIKKQKGKLILSDVLFLILLADLLWAISYTLFDLVSSNNSFISLISYESWGIAVGGFLLYLLVPAIKKAFDKTIKKISKTALSLIFFNESFYIVGRLLSYFAISLGPVALVIVVGSTQVFFGIIFGIILSIFAPNIFKEDLSRGGLLKKLGFGLLAFCGIYLIG